MRIRTNQPSRTIILLFLLLYLFAVSPLNAQTGGRIYIAALDMEMTAGVAESYRQVLSDRLRSELFSTGRFTVVERNAMEDILSEQGFQMSGCTSDQCAVEAGRLLGVERIIAGSIGMVGQTYSINIRMIDVESGVILNTRNVDYRGSIDDVLSSQLRIAARRIAGLEGDGIVGGQRTEVSGVGDAYIKSNPDGAQIYLDDRRIEGTTPIVVEGINAGLHTLRLVKDNLVGSGTVFVSPDELARVEIELEVGQAVLKVYSTPFEAQVELDGRIIGPTPQTIRDLAAGSHYVKITHPGYLVFSESISVRVGEEKRLEIELQRAAEITITSEPEGAEIFFERETQGIAPVTVTDLAPGQYQLTATLSGYRTWQETVTVREGESQSVRAQLTPRTAEVLITSNVHRGTVVLDGESQETAFPATFREIRFGSHEIRVSAPDHEPFSQTVEVNSERTYEIEAELRMHHGRLRLSGLPSGTEVFLDDRSLGVTPLDDQALPVGAYNVRLRRSGYERGNTQSLSVSNNSNTEIPFDLQPKLKSRSIVRSLFWPGTGQIYAERNSSGWMFALGEVAALGFVAYSVSDYNGKAQDYNDARQAYDNAITGSEIEATAAAAMAAEDDTNSARTTVTIAAGIAGGLYLWNVIDALLFYDFNEHESLAGGASSRPVSVTFAPMNTGYGDSVPGVSIGFVLGGQGR